MAFCRVVDPSCHSCYRLGIRVRLFSRFFKNLSLATSFTLKSYSSIIYLLVVIATLTQEHFFFCDSELFAFACLTFVTSSLIKNKPCSKKKCLNFRSDCYCNSTSRHSQGRGGHLLFYSQRPLGVVSHHHHQPSGWFILRYLDLT